MIAVKFLELSKDPNGGTIQPWVPAKKKFFPLTPELRRNRICCGAGIWAAGGGSGEAVVGGCIWWKRGAEASGAAAGGDWPGDI
jgi:hypothetical protein